MGLWASLANKGGVNFLTKELTDSFTILADQTIEADVEITGDIDVTGDINLTGPLDVTGSVTVDASGEGETIDLTGPVGITGDTEMTGDLDVTGDFTLVGDTDITGDVVLNGVLQIGDDVATPALAAGGGTNTTPLTTADPSKNFIDFRTESTDATGADSRGMYLRHYLAGAGASGETGRFFTTVEGAGAVGVHGIHSSLSFAGSGTLTGQGAAARATLHVPNSALGGTAGALYAELWADGANSDIGGNLSFMRAVFGGDAGGVANLVEANLLSIEGVGVAGANKLFQAKSAAAVTHVLKIAIDGTEYFIMLSDTV